jgi:outer membrane protein
LPLVDIEYNQTYFLSSRRGLGAYVFRDNRFAWALMLNADWGRDEGDNPRLRGLGDLDITPQLGTEMSWRALPWLTFTADAYQALDGGGHDGLWGNIGFSGRWPVAKNFSLRADTGIRWASDSYMGNVFGVSAAQSARSGLARYNPDSGVMAWQAGAALDFNLTPNWFVSPTVRYTGLLNGAADSPITQDDGQVFGGLFFGYRY